MEDNQIVTYVRDDSNQTNLNDKPLKFKSSKSLLKNQMKMKIFKQKQN